MASDRTISWDLLARDRASGPIRQVGQSFEQLGVKGVALGTILGGVGSSLLGMAQNAVTSAVQTAAGLEQAVQVEAQLE